MGVLAEIEGPTGEVTFGVVIDNRTLGKAEWHVRVDLVPRFALFCYGDVVAVDGVLATAAGRERPRRFLRVLERGKYQSSLRIVHDLADEPAREAWLDDLERVGWATRDDGEGEVWLAAPNGVDAHAALARFAWVKSIHAAA